jgi:hypothetical protein
VDGIYGRRHCPPKDQQHVEYASPLAPGDYVVAENDPKGIDSTTPQQSASQTGFFRQRNRKLW